MSEKNTLTVAEVAALIGFSRNTVKRMFERERGVLVLERSETMHKRCYRSIRIPRTVYERVIVQISVK
jgi:predicted DNA-binding transcriptional regulator YafY